jgi:hypothetical protein
MVNAVKIVVDATLDEETLNEIRTLRGIRLAHYEKMAANPEQALELLKKAGLQEASSVAQVAASAYAKIKEIQQRLVDPDIIYEDELALYLNSFNDEPE